MASQVHTISLPLELVAKGSGLAMDIGGSLAKIVYRCKGSYKNGQPLDPLQDRDTGELKLVLFPRQDVDAYIAYIQQHVDLTGNPALVTSCGFGCFENKDILEQRLNISINNTMESICFIKALLRRLCDENVSQNFLPLDSEGVKEATDLFYFMITFQYMSDQVPLPQISYFKPNMDATLHYLHASQAERVQFPCLIAMCGSVFPLQVLYENGKMDCVDVTVFGGRCFLGMSALMTGETDWPTIEHLISTHDGSTGWTHGSSSKNNEAAINARSNVKKGTDTAEGERDEEAKDEDEPPKEDPYAILAGRKLFPFGPVLSEPRETIRPGDILNTLFELVATNLGTLAYNVALAHDLKHIVFCGGFANLPHAQTLITREVLARNIRAHFTNKEDKIVDFRFVKNGGHMGSIGAYLL